MARHPGERPARPRTGPLRGGLPARHLEGVGAACLDPPVWLIEASQFYEELLGHVPAGQTNAAWTQYLMHPRYPRTPRSRNGSSTRGRRRGAGRRSPLIALFAIAIKLSDRGPVFYRQRRIGEGGREFEMVKLRSMRPDSQAGGAQWSSRDDDRVRPVGRLMRKLHLDELPQLLNVLRGDMSWSGRGPSSRSWAPPRAGVSPTTSGATW